MISIIACAIIHCEKWKEAKVPMPLIPIAIHLLERPLRTNVYTQICDGSSAGAASSQQLYSYWSNKEKVYVYAKTGERESEWVSKSNETEKKNNFIPLRANTEHEQKQHCRWINELLLVSHRHHIHTHTHTAPVHPSIPLCHSTRTACPPQIGGINCQSTSNKLIVQFVWVSRFLLSCLTYYYYFGFG